MSYSELDAKVETQRADTFSPVTKVVATLQSLLPPVSTVALAWRDGLLGEGSCSFPESADGLCQLARDCLAGNTGDLPGSVHLLEWSHDSDADYVLLIDPEQALPVARREAWQGTARVLI
ncbi:MAG: hypothetical protein RR326_10765, partial [Stenotrophomonas sp.]